jgi:hypothetical protein
MDFNKNCIENMDGFFLKNETIINTWNKISLQLSSKRLRCTHKVWHNMVKTTSYKLFFK